MDLARKYLDNLGGIYRIVQPKQYFLSHTKLILTATEGDSDTLGHCGDTDARWGHY
jgi:hypothetical protein